MESKRVSGMREIRDRQSLIEVCLGKKPADLVLSGGKVLNTYTGEIFRADVAVSGERIAAVGDVSYCTGPNTEIVDVSGYYLTPGFVDAHYHIESSRLAPWRHAEITLPRGVTVLFEDPHEACASGGLDAIRYMLENTQGSPQKVYVQISSATPPSNVETTGGLIGGKEAREAHKWSRVTGLGEMMDPLRIFSGDPRLWGLLGAAIEYEQSVEGHGGYSGATLAAYAAAGVMSTHSPRTPERALEMLRQGFHIQLKVERERETVKKLLESQIDWTLVGLAVDDRPAERIIEVGALDNEVRSAIRLGVPTIRAYQMATINNARHWRVERNHGSICPGRYADILVISDLDTVNVSRVFASGKEVARDGRLTATLEPRQAPSYALNTVRLKRKVSAKDFEVAAPFGRSTVSALVIPPGYWWGDKDSITRELPVKDGAVVADASLGINKVAVIERHKASGNVGLSFWQWGYRRGAVAMTVLHDSHNISVVGANDDDMATAVNRVAEMGGGIAVACDGKILADLPLPIFGLMSDRPASEVAEANARVEEAARFLRGGGGNTIPMDRVPHHIAMSLDKQPVDVLTFAFLTCDPWRFVITDRGIFDMTDESRIPLVW